MKKTICSVETKLFKIALIEKNEQYQVISEQFGIEEKTRPVKDLRLALNIYSDLFETLENNFN